MSLIKKPKVGRKDDRGFLQIREAKGLSLRWIRYILSFCQRYLLSPSCVDVPADICIEHIEEKS